VVRSSLELPSPLRNLLHFSRCSTRHQDAAGRLAYQTHRPRDRRHLHMPVDGFPRHENARRVIRLGASESALKMRALAASAALQVTIQEPAERKITKNKPKSLISW